MTRAAFSPSRERRSGDAEPPPDEIRTVRSQGGVGRCSKKADTELKASLCANEWASGRSQSKLPDKDG